MSMRAWDAVRRRAYRQGLLTPAGGVAAILALLAMAWLVAVASPWPATPDGEIHLHRIRALADALRQGVLYPRWFPDFAFGYGHPILHYYAPASYYPPALLHLAGFDLLAATRLILAFVYGASGLAFYWALRPITSPAATLFGVVLYLSFPYRVYDLLIRGALPEFAAFLWLPLILGGALRSMRPDAPARALLGTGVAWAGLALTHNLTAFMAATAILVAIPVAPLLNPTQNRGYAKSLLHSGWRLGLPAFLGLLLSAFYSAPVLFETQWVGIGSDPEAAGYARHFTAWRNLTQWQWFYAYPDAAAPTVPLPWFAPAVVVLALAALARAGRRMPLALALLGVLGVAWLTTEGSHILWRMGEPVISKLQFPWRWQTLLMLLLALTGSLTVQRLLAPAPGGRAGDTPISIPTHPASMAALTVAGLLVMVSSLPPRTLPAATPDLSREGLWAWDATHNQVGTTWTGEYLPHWVQAPRWAIGRAPETPAARTDAVDLSAIPTAGEYLGWGYTITATAPVTATFDQFYFPPWRVTVDGRPQPTAPKGPLGLLGFGVPAGAHTVTVELGNSDAQRVGWGMTALGWMVGLALLYPAYRRRPKRAGDWGSLLLWLLAGGALLLAATDWTHQRFSPTPVGADFGAVELGGVHARAVAAGDPAAITLYWTIQEIPQALTAFIHVLDGDGAIVAQWDEPLGGGYRPPQRMRPGMLLRQRVAVPMPQLSPGRYAVRVGLYPVGVPDGPLPAEGYPTARVPAGELIVQP